MTGNTLSLGQQANWHAALIKAAPRTISPEAALLWEQNSDKLATALASALCPLATPMPRKARVTPIHVDRSARPVYPDWMDPAYINTPEFLALERSGLSDYDLAKIVQWLHDGQKNGGRVTGNQIHEYLKAGNMLEGCLGFADLLAIQKLDVDNFRKYFAGKAVFGWKSVVRFRNGNLYVPYLFEVGGQVKFRWFWLGNVFDVDNPALRFAK